MSWMLLLLGLLLSWCSSVLCTSLVDGSGGFYGARDKIVMNISITFFVHLHRERERVSARRTHWVLQFTYFQIN